MNPNPATPTALPPVEVTLTAVTKKYGPGAPQVLRDLNLRVLTGEFLAVVGPSGCGKSTLLNLIGGLDRPDSGEIRVAAKSLADLNDRDLSAFRNRMVGFIFQTYHLHPRMTAIENVMLPGIIAGQTREQARDAAHATLSRLAMAPYADKMPRALSGGQMQRVAIARALALSPRILLADEPTGNLDERAGQELLELMAELNRTEKLTALLVTHEARVQRYATRSVAMENGALVS